jgi:hypothetical protein
MRSNPVRCDLENSGLKLDIRPLQAEYLALAEAQRECNRRHQQAGRFVTDRYRPLDLGAVRDSVPGLIGGQVHAQSEELPTTPARVSALSTSTACFPIQPPLSHRARKDNRPHHPHEPVDNRGASYPEGRHAGLAVGPNSDRRSAHPTRPSRPPR